MTKAEAERSLAECSPEWIAEHNAEVVKRKDGDYAVQVQSNDPEFKEAVTQLFKKLKRESYDPVTESSAKHDMLTGPCKCKAWH